MRLKIVFLAVLVAWMPAAAQFGGGGGATLRGLRRAGQEAQTG